MPEVVRIIGDDWVRPQSNVVIPPLPPPTAYAAPCPVCGTHAGACTGPGGPTMPASPIHDHSTLVVVTEETIERRMPLGVTDPKRASKILVFNKGQIVPRSKVAMAEERGVEVQFTDVLPTGHPGVRSGAVVSEDLAAEAAAIKEQALAEGTQQPVHDALLKVAQAVDPEYKTAHKVDAAYAADLADGETAFRPDADGELVEVTGPDNRFEPLPKGEAVETVETNTSEED